MISHMKNIDKIYVINLKRRPDRLELFKKKLPFDPNLVETFEGIDGSTLQVTDDIISLFKHNYFNFKRGVIGCALSHYYLWKKISESEHKNVLIFEDDVFFSKDFLNLWNNYISSDFADINDQIDTLFIGGGFTLNTVANLSYIKKLNTHIGTPNRQTNDKLGSWGDGDPSKQTGYPFTAHSYIMTKTGATNFCQLINDQSKKNIGILQPIDVFMLENYPKIKIAVSNPILCYSPINYKTDIQKDFKSIFHNFSKQERKNKNIINIMFLNFWPKFPPECNFFQHLLRKFSKSLIVVVYDIQQADILFYSIFGNQHLSLPDNSAKKIFFTGENYRADINSDLSLTFDRYDYTTGINPDKYFRLPLWLTFVDWFDYPYKLKDFKDPAPAPVEWFYKKNKDIKDILKSKNKFCAFIVSNESNPIRNNIFHELSKYKKVDSAGKAFNNIGEPLPGDYLDKMEFLKPYKFCIAFENASQEGYCTEKILHAFAAGCIPLYWGDSTVKLDFNEKAFINMHDFKDMDAFIEYIKKVDQDDQLWFKIYSEMCFKLSIKNIYLYLENTYNVIIKNL